MKRAHTRRIGEDPAASDFGKLTSAFGGTWLESMDRSQEVFVHGLRSLQEEAVRFMDHRLERDSEVLKEYQNCRNLFDVFAIQQKWLAGMGTDYFREGIKLSQLLRDIVTEEVTELSDVAQSAPGGTEEERRSAA